MRVFKDSNVDYRGNALAKMIQWVGYRNLGKYTLGFELAHERERIHEDGKVVVR